MPLLVFSHVLDLRHFAWPGIAAIQFSAQSGLRKIYLNSLKYNGIGASAGTLHNQAAAAVRFRSDSTKDATISKRLHFDQSRFGRRLLAMKCRPADQLASGSRCAGQIELVALWLCCVREWKRKLRALDIELSPSFGRPRITRTAGQFRRQRASQWPAMGSQQVAAAERRAFGMAIVSRVAWRGNTRTPDRVAIGSHLYRKSNPFLFITVLVPVGRESFLVTTKRARERKSVVRRAPRPSASISVRGQARLIGGRRAAKEEANGGRERRERDEGGRSLRSCRSGLLADEPPFGRYSNDGDTNGRPTVCPCVRLFVCPPAGLVCVCRALAVAVAVVVPASGVLLRARESLAAKEATE